jgi:hypothetical protein
MSYTKIDRSLTATMLALFVGCAASNGAPLSETTSPRDQADTHGGGQAPSLSLARNSGAENVAGAEDLPEAPWHADPLADNDVAEPIVRAWQGAENRDWCAPLAPRSLGQGEGARARISELHGGWSVEFDKPGAPGLEPSGSACEDCGRSAFGIAGTALSPEEVTDLGETRVAPSFRDGSSASFSHGDGATAATITVRGQDCVYQVWSFLGEEHARALVGELRFVAVGSDSSDRRVAEASF